MATTNDSGIGKKPLQLATFYVGDLHFGVDVMKVQELIRYQEMTTVPLASNVIEGLINLRGVIIVALDLRRRLHMDPLQSEDKPMNVVIRTDDGIVSLLVDEIGDVLEVTPDRFEHTPETLEGEYRDLISGVYKLDNELLLVLDTERAVDVHGLPH